MSFLHQASRAKSYSFRSIQSTFLRTFTASTHAQPKNIMFLGAPGVGKGTYASRVAPLLNIPTISTGDLVRDEIETKSTLGQQIKDYSNKGLLVPDAIILEMVEKRLSQADAQNGYLLDGFPRNLAQAESFRKISTLSLVLDIELPEWILMDKIMGRRVCNDCGTGYNISSIDNGEYTMLPLLPKVPNTCDNCGGTNLIQRADDTEEIVRDRLKVYHEQTFPLIQYYSEMGILRSFHVKKGLEDLPDLLQVVEDAISNNADCRALEHHT